MACGPYFAPKIKAEGCSPASGQASHCTPERCCRSLPTRHPRTGNPSGRPCASSFSKRRHPSSPTPSATTTSTSPRSGPRTRRLEDLRSRRPQSVTTRGPGQEDRLLGSTEPTSLNGRRTERQKRAFDHGWRPLSLGAYTVEWTVFGGNVASRKDDQPVWRNGPLTGRQALAALALFWTVGACLLVASWRSAVAEDRLVRLLPVPGANCSPRWNAGSRSTAR